MKSATVRWTLKLPLNGTGWGGVSHLSTLSCPCREHPSPRYCTSTGLLAPSHSWRWYHIWGFTEDELRGLAAGIHDETRSLPWPNSLRWPPRDTIGVKEKAMATWVASTWRDVLKFDRGHLVDDNNNSNVGSSHCHWRTWSKSFREVQIHSWDSSRGANEQAVFQLSRDPYGG